LEAKAREREVVFTPTLQELRQSSRNVESWASDWKRDENLAGCRQACGNAGGDQRKKCI
jgi:hypothetical protein